MKRISLLAAACLLLGSATGAAEYHVDRSRDNQVMFISDAPLGDFEGITEKIDGYVFWPGQELPTEQAVMDSSELHYEVDLASLDTGIGMRNRDMREDYLETDKYPYAVYTGRLTSFSKVNDTLFETTAAGTMKIHGIERPLDVTVRLIPQGNGFLASTEFQVNLKDYDIEVPKFMFLKVNEIIELELDFFVRLVSEKD